MNDCETAFVVIPSRQKRNVTLLSLSKDRWNGFWQKLSVDVRSEAREFVGSFFHSRVENLLRGHGAQFLE